MSLTVGTDTYITLENANTYHASRGNTAWTNSTDDTAKEAALRKATSFLDTIGRGKWKGVRATSGQALAWPRTDVVDEDGYDIAFDAIPAALAQACAEASLRYLNGEDLLPDKTDNVASESVAGAVSVSYFEDKSNIPTYSFIYGILDGLVNSPLGDGGTKISFNTKGYEYVGWL